MFRTTVALAALVGSLVPVGLNAADDGQPAVHERPTHHEFQAKCTISHTANDDPIVYPGQPGRSHHHTFLGNTGTDAHSTLESLMAGRTSCKVPADRSAYWFPTMYKGDTPVLSTWHQVI